MDAPRSRWSVVPAIAGLAFAQQALYFALSAGLAPAAPVAPRNWGVTAIFVLGSTLLNTVFYCAAWLGLLGPGRIAERRKRVWLGGLAAAFFFFTLASLLTAQVDPKGPFGSYAQMATLVATLAAAFKLDDARGAVGPMENDPLKRD